MPQTATKSLDNGTANIQANTHSFGFGRDIHTEKFRRYIRGDPRAVVNDTALHILRAA